MPPGPPLERLKSALRQRVENGGRYGAIIFAAVASFLSVECLLSITLAKTTAAASVAIGTMTLIFYYLSFLICFPPSDY